MDITKWYAEQRQEIISQHGEPTPGSESEKLLAKAKNRYQYEKRKQQKQDRRDKKIEKLEALVGKGVELPSIQVPEHDLLGFDETERKIIRAHFADTLLTPGEIAEKLGSGMSQQLVTGILNKPSVRELKHKVMVENLSGSFWIAIREGLAQRDDKIVKLVADMGIVEVEPHKQENLTPYSWSNELEELLRAQADWLTVINSNGPKYNLLMKCPGATETREVEYEG